MKVIVDLKEIATYYQLHQADGPQARDLILKDIQHDHPKLYQAIHGGDLRSPVRRPGPVAGPGPRTPSSPTCANAPTRGGVVALLDGSARNVPTAQEFQACRPARKVTGSENASMAVVYVNDKPVDIGTEKLNLIQAAQKGGVFMPHYCWHPALTVVASCRMCLVEVGEKKPDGTIAMQPKVVPGCQTPAKDGTVIVTNSQKARDAQKQTLEGILLNHPLDCPVCDKAGECLLQDYSYDYGKSQSRMIDEKNTPPNKPHIGHNITLFTDRCIMCSRCVRFTREISGTAELQVINRGDHSEIDIFPGEPLNNKLASNVVDLCPVGALCSKDFLYKQRVWNLKTQEQRLPRLLDRLQHPPRRQQEHRLSAAAARQPAGAGPFHVRRRPARLPLHQLEGALPPADGPPRTASWSAVPWPDASTAIRQAFQAAAAKDGSGSRRRAVAVSDLRGSVSAGEVHQGAVAAGPAGARPGAGRRRGRHLSEGPPRPAGAAGEVHDPGREVPQSQGRRGGAEPLPGQGHRLRRRR